MAPGGPTVLTQEPAGWLGWGQPGVCPVEVSHLATRPGWASKGPGVHSQALATGWEAIFCLPWLCPAPCPRRGWVTRYSLWFHTQKWECGGPWPFPSAPSALCSQTWHGGHAHVRQGARGLPLGAGAARWVLSLKGHVAPPPSPFRGLLSGTSGWRVTRLGGCS